MSRPCGAQRTYVLAVETISDLPIAHAGVPEYADVVEDDALVRCTRPLAPSLRPLFSHARCEAFRASQPHATCLGRGKGGLRALADQFRLALGNRGEDVDGEVVGLRDVARLE